MSGSNTKIYHSLSKAVGYRRLASERGVTDGADTGFCERVWCAIGLLTFGSDGAACRIGSVFGGVVKF